MKKNLFLITVLVLSLAFTTGCGLFSSNNDAATVPTVATKTTLAGAAVFPAAAGVPTPAPGRNLAPSATNYSARVVDVAGNVIATDNTLTLSGTTLAYTFDITTYNGTQYFVEVLHKATGKRVLRKALGILVAPETTGTISGVDCNAGTTARAAVIKKIIKKATKTAAETALANSSITADTVTTLGATNDVVAQQLTSITNSVASIKSLVAALRQQVQIMAAGIAAVETDSAKVTALTGTFDISEPEGLQDTALNVVKSTDAAVQTAVTTEAANLLDENDGAAPNNLTFITSALGVPTVIAANNVANLGANVVITSTQVNTVGEATTTASATAIAPPYISSVTVNGTTTTIYSQSSATATPVVAPLATAGMNYGSASILINFSEAVELTSSTVMKFKITETVAGVATTKTVVYGAATKTGEITWAAAFGTATPALTGNILTLAAGSGTTKLGETSAGAMQAVTVKVSLVAITGVIKAGTSATPTYFNSPKAGTIGQFSLTAHLQ